MENSAKLRVFMIEPTEIEKVIYVFARDTYISVENKQILIPYFARCSFDIPNNEIYIEYRMKIVGGTNKIVIYFVDKRIYSHQLKIVPESFYKDYRATSVAASIDLDDFVFYHHVIEIENDLEKIDRVFNPYLKIKKLEEDLKKALKKENYLEAARLRDIILVEKFKK